MKYKRRKHRLIPVFLDSLENQFWCLHVNCPNILSILIFRPKSINKSNYFLPGRKKQKPGLLRAGLFIRILVKDQCASVLATGTPISRALAISLTAQSTSFLVITRGGAKRMVWEWVSLASIPSFIIRSQ
jgi:hypothetical protein